MRPVELVVLYCAIQDKKFGVLTLSYGIYPCIMCTPILKPVFRKKNTFQHHSCQKIIFWKNSAEMSNLALPARKSVTGVDANHLMFCLFSDTSSFMMFSSFSSAVLHN